MQGESALPGLGEGPEAAVSGRAERVELVSGFSAQEFPHKAAGGPSHKMPTKMWTGTHTVHRAIATNRHRAQLDPG